MAGNYTYAPDKIQENGKDRMRFELGDTMVEGRSDTSALTDEEIEAAFKMYPDSWKRAKLALLESICRRFAYEVDTKEGPLSFSLNQRAKLWREAEAGGGDGKRYRSCFGHFREKETAVFLRRNDGKSENRKEAW